MPFSLLNLFRREPPRRTTDQVTFDENLLRNINWSIDQLIQANLPPETILLNSHYRDLFIREAGPDLISNTRIRDHIRNYIGSYQGIPVCVHLGTGVNTYTIAITRDGDRTYVNHMNIRKRCAPGNHVWQGKVCLDCGADKPQPKVTNPGQMASDIRIIS